MGGTSGVFAFDDSAASAWHGVSWGQIIAQAVIWAGIAGGVAAVIATVPMFRHPTLRIWRGLLLDFGTTCTGPVYSWTCTKTREAGTGWCLCLQRGVAEVELLLDDRGWAHIRQFWSRARQRQLRCTELSGCFVLSSN